KQLRTTQGGRKAALLAFGPTRALDAQHARKAIRRGSDFSDTTERALTTPANFGLNGNVSRAGNA
ncbi:hypothetical protein XocUg1_22900, partial [Xanthomonas oryzae pv. oryzicola]|uniref:hypothetical protein n=1 Tax=Xanthomonas oryzae TaxID=347 RepID=UPI002DEC99B8|nr:hypothetical protein [Xanthomonas oryzae pv. oryzicola]